MNTIRTANLSDYILLVILSAIWGSAFVSIEFALNDFTPLIIAFGRIFLASLFLLFIVYLTQLHHFLNKKYQKSINFKSQTP